MYYGRKKGLIIGIVVAIIVILIAIISVFVVLKTDLFKSNKTLFWKYASLQLESFNQTPNIQLEEIEKLKVQSPYTYQGELILDSSDEESSSLENIKLNIVGENDKTNEYSHVNTKIVTAYLGVRNENLKVLFQKLGVQDTSSIPDEITANNYSEILKFSKVDLEHLKETYTNVIANNITSESYSRQTSAVVEIDGASYNTTSYRLDLSSEQIVSILEDVLNTLKTDSITLNLIIEKAKLLGLTDEEITIEDLTSAIDEAISELEQEEFQDISFVVYNYKGETIQAEMIVRNQGKATINAKKDNIKVTYESYEEENNVTIELINNVTTTRSNMQVKIDVNGETQVNIDIINTGSATQRSLNTTCEISVVSEETEVNATYNQTIEFIDELEETITLDETNSVVLNDYNAQDMKALVEAISARTTEVIGQKVQTLLANIIVNSAYNTIQNDNTFNNLSNTSI